MLVPVFGFALLRQGFHLSEWTRNCIPLSTAVKWLKNFSWWLICLWADYPWNKCSYYQSFTVDASLTYVRKCQEEREAFVFAFSFPFTITHRNFESDFEIINEPSILCPAFSFVSPMEVFRNFTGANLNLTLTYIHTKMTFSNWLSSSGAQTGTKQS